MCHGNFLGHQLQASHLRATGITKEDHPHRIFLPNPPGSACCLLQRINVITSLQEGNGRKVEQIQAGLHQLRVGDQHVDAAINPVAGCYVKVTQAAAFAVTAVGGSGPTAAEIAAAVLAVLGPSFAAVPADVWDEVL